jgi:hypothetical protein
MASVTSHAGIKDFRRGSRAGLRSNQEAAAFKLAADRADC